MKECRTTRIKKITKKATILFMIEALFLSTIISPASAEENLFGNGYRDYLNDKIRNGYNLDTFMGLDRGQKEKLAKRKQIEELVESSRGANADLDRSVQKDSVEKAQNSQVFQEEIAEQRKQREKNAAATGEFQYIAYADGKKEYFKDGLVTRIDNENVTDEFGNTSRKDTRNMKYNDKRLITGYEATVSDGFGVTTKVIFDGAEYSSDSVFYGNHITRANKNLTKYHVREIDGGGNISDRYWQADRVEGKFVTAISQNVINPIYGNYSFQRSDIRYENNDPERMASYHEEGRGTDGLYYALDRTNTTYDGKGKTATYLEAKTVTQLDGSKVKTTEYAQFEYLEGPDSDRILKSTITTTAKNPDGSYRIETNTITYNYDANKKLMGGSGFNSFTGQEADWYEYTDSKGRALSRKTDKNGKLTHSYIDPDKLKHEIVPEGQVRARLKDGNKFSGTSQVEYEVLSGKPMVKKTDSRVFYYGRNIRDDELLRIEYSTIIYNNGLINNLQRALGGKEHRETTQPLIDPDNSHLQTRDITSTNIYDEKGNLADVEASGKGSGWEYQPTQGWYGQYTNTVREEYEVILGKPVKRGEDEYKNYK